MSSLLRTIHVRLSRGARRRRARPSRPHFFSCASSSPPKHGLLQNETAFPCLLCTSRARDLASPRSSVRARRDACVGREHWPAQALLRAPSSPLSLLFSCRPPCAQAAPALRRAARQQRSSRRTSAVRSSSCCASLGAEDERPRENPPGRTCAPMADNEDAPQVRSTRTDAHLVRVVPAVLHHLREPGVGLLRDADEHSKADALPCAPVAPNRLPTLRRRRPRRLCGSRRPCSRPSMADSSRRKRA